MMHINRSKVLVQVLQGNINILTACHKFYSLNDEHFLNKGFPSAVLHFCNQIRFAFCHECKAFIQFTLSTPNSIIKFYSSRSKQLATATAPDFTLI